MIHLGIRILNLEIDLEFYIWESAYYCWRGIWNYVHFTVVDTSGSFHVTDIDRSENWDLNAIDVCRPFCVTAAMSGIMMLFDAFGSWLVYTDFSSGIWYVHSVDISGSQHVNAIVRSGQQNMFLLLAHLEFGMLLMRIYLEVDMLILCLYYM